MTEADLMRDLDEAEMILVGLGSEFDIYGSMGGHESKNGPGAPDAALKVTKALENSEYAWLIPAYRDYVTCESREEQGAGKEAESGAEENTVRTSLLRLRELLEGRNCFLISQAQNGMIPRIKWREGRLVMPCGSALKKQCARGCGTYSSLTPEEQSALYECCAGLEGWLVSEEAGEEYPDHVLRALKLIGKNSEKDGTASVLREKIPEDLLGKCPCCGEGMVLNVVQAPGYDERGYLDDWGRYTKWLQGSVNRRLLVLELGVGMQYPGMIRIPFERVVFLNRKAKMYRIHENLYQVPENFREKGIGIAENAIDWLNNL